MRPERDGRAGKAGGTAIGCVVAMAFLALVPAPAAAAPWWMPWGRGPHGYDPNTVVTLEATVRVAKPAPPMPSLECTMERGELLSAVLGPPWYLQQTGITFAAGDRVRIEGSQLMDDAGRLVVVAARVQKLPDGPTLRLRDEQGLPLWGGMRGGGMGGHGRGPMR